MQKGFAFTKLADRLMSITELSEEDLDLLTRMPSAIAHFSSHDQVLRKTDHPSRCCLLLKGYLCWRDDNSGQITSIHVPGDVPDLAPNVSRSPSAHLAALGPTVVGLVPRSFFHEISELSPSLRSALQFLTFLDTACLRNWIVNLGSRDSLTRVAHLICELHVRLEAVGLAKDRRFPSPFTQSDLASACAISAVHANRTIQELRRRQMLQWQSRTITILDWTALSRLAGFEPDYLGLRSLPSPTGRQTATALTPADNAQLLLSD